MTMDSKHEKSTKLIEDFLGYQSAVAYHESWDSLMPVIKKIFKRKDSLLTAPQEVDKVLIKTNLLEGNLDKTYKAVVSFILFYNNEN